MVPNPANRQPEPPPESSSPAFREWFTHHQENAELKAVCSQPAAPYSTYRIGGNMDIAWHPESVEATVKLLHALAPFLNNRETGLEILGWGSNTVIATRGIRCNTLVTRKLSAIRLVTGSDPEEGRYYIEAGVHLAKVAKTIVDAERSGAEFFIGIPGTMGGAAVMNAGAMGQETGGIVKRLFVFDLPSGEAGWLEADTMHYAYRYSALNPRNRIVLACECKFPPGDVEASRAKMEANMAFRKAYHPTEPNGGSVFRNPEGGPPVGKMMDELGAKGAWREGQAMVSPLHGNFIVNLGGATAEDVLRLMHRMQAAALEAYGQRIYPENRFIGDATPAEQALWQSLKEGDAHHHVG